MGISTRILSTINYIILRDSRVTIDKNLEELYDRNIVVLRSINETIGELKGNTETFIKSSLEEMESYSRVCSVAYERVGVRPKSSHINVDLISSNFNNKFEKCLSHLKVAINLTPRFSAIRSMRFITNI